MPLKRFGVARILNKRGFCSRSKAEMLVREGRVALNGRAVFDPETPATETSQITVDGTPVVQTDHVYFAMHKPRGIVTSASDEKGRKTVMDILQGKLPQHVFPVGRLDKASEGLLLFTNDTAFADRILAPETHLEKEYHVQVSRVPTDLEMEKMQRGLWVPPRVFGEDPEFMQMANVQILRTGQKNAWLSVVLHEGKNREIRRILQTFEIEVLRLVRVRIGSWTLGALKPGEFVQLSLDNK
ncbi:MAG: rRNA pseudouridine synthase [Fibrobacter sp.]|nr:rRNA pseudouridine synthase [Fibrobacter sp.]